MKYTRIIAAYIGSASLTLSAPVGSRTASDSNVASIHSDFSQTSTHIGFHAPKLPTNYIQNHATENISLFVQRQVDEGDFKLNRRGPTKNDAVDGEDWTMDDGNDRHTFDPSDPSEDETSSSPPPTERRLRPRPTPVGFQPSNSRNKPPTTHVSQNTRGAFKQRKQQINVQELKGALREPRNNALSTKSKPQKTVRWDLPEGEPMQKLETQFEKLSSSDGGTRSTHLNTPARHRRFFVKSSSSENVDSSVPTVDPSSPVDNPSSPVNNPSSPVDNPSSPVNNPSSPVDSPSSPVDNPSSPVNNPSSPVDSPSSPVENPSAPVDDPSTPVENPSSPVDDPSAPVDDPSASDDESSSLSSGPPSPVSLRRSSRFVTRNQGRSASGRPNSSRKRTNNHSSPIGIRRSPRFATHDQVTADQDRRTSKRLRLPSKPTDNTPSIEDVPKRELPQRAARVHKTTDQDRRASKRLNLPNEPIDNPPSIEDVPKRELPQRAVRDHKTTDQDRRASKRLNLPNEPIGNTPSIEDAPKRELPQRAVRDQSTTGQGQRASRRRNPSRSKTPLDIEDVPMRESSKRAARDQVTPSRDQRTSKRGNTPSKPSASSPQNPVTIEDVPDDAPGKPSAFSSKNLVTVEDAPNDIPVDTSNFDVKPPREKGKTERIPGKAREGAGSAESVSTRKERPGKMPFLQQNASRKPLEEKPRVFIRPRLPSESEDSEPNKQAHGERMLMVETPRATQAFPSEGLSNQSSGSEASGSQQSGNVPKSFWRRKRLSAKSGSNKRTKGKRPTVIIPVARRTRDFPSTPITSSQVDITPKTLPTKGLPIRNPQWEASGSQQPGNLPEGFLRPGPLSLSTESKSERQAKGQKRQTIKIPKAHQTQDVPSTSITTSHAGNVREGHSWKDLLHDTPGSGASGSYQLEKKPEDTLHTKPSLLSVESESRKQTDGERKLAVENPTARQIRNLPSPTIASSQNGNVRKPHFLDGLLAPESKDKRYVQSGKVTPVQQQEYEPDSSLYLRPPTSSVIPESKKRKREQADDEREQTIKMPKISHFQFQPPWRYSQDNYTPGPSRSTASSEIPNARNQRSIQFLLNDAPEDTLGRAAQPNQGEKPRIMRISGNAQGNPRFTGSEPTQKEQPGKTPVSHFGHPSQLAESESKKRKRLQVDEEREQTVKVPKAGQWNEVTSGPSRSPVYSPPTTASSRTDSVRRPFSIESMLSDTSGDSFNRAAQLDRKGKGKARDDDWIPESRNSEREQLGGFKFRPPYGPSWPTAPSQIADIPNIPSLSSNRVAQSLPGERHPVAPGSHSNQPLMFPPPQSGPSRSGDPYRSTTE